MKPFLIIVDGPMGAGKSTVVKALHRKMPSSALIMLDFVRRIISDFDLDNEKHHRIASEMLNIMIKKYLKEGYNVIIEKAITTEEDLKIFKKITNGKSKILIYRIEAPLEARIKRVKERKIPSHLKKGSTLERINRNNHYYDKLKCEHTDRIFDSTKLSSRQIINVILKDCLVKKSKPQAF